MIQYQQDWIMRQVESMVSFMIGVIGLLIGQKADSIEIRKFEQTAAQTNTLYWKFHEFVTRRELCSAENMLYEAIDRNDTNALNAALLFYSEINKLSDAELEKNNFPRDEISGGLRDICRIYGIELPSVFE